MEKTITLCRMGDSLGSVFPQDVLERMNVGEGDRLFVIELENGILLSPCDPKSGRVVDAYGLLSRAYRNTLRELAQ